MVMDDALPRKQNGNRKARGIEKQCWHVLVHLEIIRYNIFARMSQFTIAA